MRLFTIGDIHGRYNEMLNLLNYANFKLGEDILIATGDLIDRGPKSYDVVKWFMNNNSATNGMVQSIFGNHEHLFISYISGHLPHEDYFNKRIGGEATIQSYSHNKVTEAELSEHLSFLGKLPLCIELEDFIISHAGFNISKPSNHQGVSETVWSSYDEDKKIYNQDLSKFNKTIVVGHEPTLYIYEKKNNEKKYELWKDTNLLCIDCSFHKARKMCLVDLYGNTAYYYDFAMKNCYTKEIEDSKKNKDKNMLETLHSNLKKINNFKGAI